jgi:hypothetical protein
MKRILYRCICGILFFLLLIQIKWIINIEKENVSLQQYYNQSNEVKEVASSTMQPISLYSVLETIYIESAKCKVVNFTLSEDAKYLEAEISMLGTINDFELELNNIQKSRGFKEIKKYIEEEDETKKVYITFELKN